MSLPANEVTTRTLAAPPPGAFCKHEGMAECHPGCGHFHCPCGVEWDDGADGYFPPEEWEEAA